MIFEAIHSVTSDTKISQYQSQTIYGETIHLYLFLKLKAYWLLLLIYIIFKHCIQDVFLDFFFVWFFCGVIFIESNLVEQVPGEPHTVCEGATSLHGYMSWQNLTQGWNFILCFRRSSLCNPNKSIPGKAITPPTTVIWLYLCVWFFWHIKANQESYNIEWCQQTLFQNNSFKRT